MEINWAEVMWIPFIWFLAATAIVGILEIKGEKLKELDPEMYPKRRWALLIYAFVLGSINMAQIAAHIELIPFFNYTMTFFLFVRFFFIESGPKRTMARNMSIFTLAFALLSLLG